MPTKHDYALVMRRAALDSTTANEAILASFTFDRMSEIEQTRVLQRAARAAMRQVKAIANFAKATGKLALAAALVTELSACAGIYEKPGGTIGEWSQVKAECHLEAAKAVPVAPALMVAPGSSYVATNCDKRGRHCSEYSTYQPPTLQAVDANEPLRGEVVEGCYARHGWTRYSPL